MSKKFICPKIGTECQDAAICQRANEPLKGSIVRIRQEVGGIRWQTALQALKRELDVQFQSLGAEVYPEGDKEDGVKICPRDIVTGDFGIKYGVGTATVAIISYAERCVDHVIADLKR